MLESLEWIAELLNGRIAVVVGTLAVCFIGCGALTGHLNQSRLVRVLLGLGIVFAAPQIAEALRTQSSIAVEITARKKEPVFEQKQEPEQPRTICWTC